MRYPTSQEQSQHLDRIPTRMKMVSKIITGGIPKGEIIVYAAKSNVGNPKFPQPLVRRSHKLSNIKLTALGGIFMVGLYIIIFIAKTGEWFWGILPDRCEAKDCRRMGIRGNENLENGIRLCDFCSFAQSHDRASRK